MQKKVGICLVALACLFLLLSGMLSSSFAKTYNLKQYFILEQGDYGVYLAMEEEVGEPEDEGVVTVEEEDEDDDEGEEEEEEDEE